MRILNKPLMISLFDLQRINKIYLKKTRLSIGKFLHLYFLYFFIDFVLYNELYFLLKKAMPIK